MDINIPMHIQYELETYISNALKQQTVNMRDLIFHATLYGMELQKNSNKSFPTIISNEFHKNCICETCLRSDYYERITYNFFDLIFSLVNDYIEKNIFIVLSPYPELTTTEIPVELCNKHGIKIIDIQKTLHILQIEVTFEFYGSIATIAALRDFPLTFTAIIELNNSFSFGFYNSASELISQIVRINFLDDEQLCSQNSQNLYSFYESLPKKIENH